MRPTKLRVLYIEEPSRQRDEVVAALGRHNVAVKLASSPREATSALTRSTFDAIVIDALLRKGSALRWIAARSRNGETTPTVLLCGLEQHRQIQAGYRAGARLCLSRPIRGDVLGYHLQGVLAAAQPRTVRLGKLSLDPLRRLLAFPGGRTVPLPPQEFVFLYTLAGQLGEPISHRELIDQVWSHKPPPGTRSDLPPVVMRLRRLLGGYAWMVRAVHGSGYQLSVDPPSK